MQDGCDKLATSNSENLSTASFTPTTEATEGARFQFPTQGQGEANMMDVAPVATEIAETNLFGFLHGEYPWSGGGNYFVCG
jgi:hypothetical protein